MYIQYMISNPVNRYGFTMFVVIIGIRDRVNSM